MIKVLICDDNPNITQQVYKLLKKFEQTSKIELDITVNNSSEIIFKKDGKYDIAIIDIEMPGINGIKLSENLKLKNPNIIVMILTSFNNYLDDAMKIHVFRYLSKPIDINRFYNNLKDALGEYRLISKAITISIKDEVYLIKTKDILYIENQKRGSIIHTKNNSFAVDKKPKDVLQMIDQNNCFVYSHNSIIVNLQNVINFNKQEIVMRKNNDETVSTYISQRKYSKFKKSFLNFAGDLKLIYFVIVLHIFSNNL